MVRFRQSWQLSLEKNDFDFVFSLEFFIRTLFADTNCKPSEAFDVKVFIFASSFDPF